MIIYSDFGIDLYLKTAIFAEGKWTNEKVDVGVLELLEKRAGMFNYKNTYLYLFVKTEFTNSEVKKLFDRNSENTLKAQPYVYLTITVRIGSNFMWKKIWVIMLVILLGFTIVVFLFIPEELGIPKGEKAIFVAFSKSYMKFDEGNFKPAVDNDIYDLSEYNEEMGNIIRGIKIYPTFKGLFNKDDYNLENTDSVVNIYIFDVSSENSKENMTELAVDSEGYAVYNRTDRIYLRSLGINKKDKAYKLMKEIKELIKAKGIRKESVK